MISVGDFFVPRFFSIGQLVGWVRKHMEHINLPSLDTMMQLW